MAEEAERVLQAYIACFNGISGGIVLEDLQRAYGDRISHTPGDPCTTAYYEGQRSVLLNIRRAMREAEAMPQAGTVQVTRM